MSPYDTFISLAILSGAFLFIAGLLIGQEVGRNESAVLAWLRTLTKTPDEQETEL